MGKLNQVSGTGIDTFGTGNGLEFKIYPNPARGKVNLDINPIWGANPKTGEGAIRYQPLTSNQQPGYRLFFCFFRTNSAQNPANSKKMPANSNSFQNKFSYTLLLLQKFFLEKNRIFIKPNP